MMSKIERTALIKSLSTAIDKKNQSLKDEIRAVRAEHQNRILDLEIKVSELQAQLAIHEAQ